MTVLLWLCLIPIILLNCNSPLPHGLCPYMWKELGSQEKLQAEEEGRNKCCGGGGGVCCGSWGKVENPSPF